MQKIFFKNNKSIDDAKNSEEKQLLEAIEEARYALESARSLFDNVQESILIELAIYKEEAAKRRYEDLISLAKKRGLRVSYEYVIEHCYKVAE